jgi:flagellar assembly protein FliH
MAGNFKQQKFTVRTEGPGAAGVTIVEESDSRVMKGNAPAMPEVTDFELPKIKRQGEGSYQATRAKYGALAATDLDRQARTQKDSRFSLNPLLRDPLSVDTEEKRVIEERVRERVASVAEDSKKRAAEVGYNEGFKKGYDEAFAKFQKEAADRLGRFEALLGACESAKQEIYRANERFLIELVFRIGRMVLLRELTTDKQYISRLARELIEKIGIRENITLYIHPSELETAKMIEESVGKFIGGLNNLKVEASTDIRQGGCAIETEWNAIDASIQTQLEGLYDALIGSGEVKLVSDPKGSA